MDVGPFSYTTSKGEWFDKLCLLLNDGNCDRVNQLWLSLPATLPQNRSCI